MSFEGLELLEDPFEILDMPNNGILQTKILDFKMGMTKIAPRGTKPGEFKVLETLRIHVPHIWKPVGVSYWDITSKTLTAQILPYLQKPESKKKVYKITKYGIAPKARFSLDTIPEPKAAKDKEQLRKEGLRYQSEWFPVGILDDAE